MKSQKGRHNLCNVGDPLQQIHTHIVAEILVTQHDSTNKVK